MKKKGFTLIELLAVIIILALILIIAIPRIMDAVREARMKSFENDVVAVYKTMEKALHEFELNMPEGREDEYEEYFSSQYIFPRYSNTTGSMGEYDSYVQTDNNCPAEFWSSSKEHCQYFYNPEIGVDSLLLIVEIPKGIQPYYSKNDNLHFANEGDDSSRSPVCQALYMPYWKNLFTMDYNVNDPNYGYLFNLPVSKDATGFLYWKCGSEGE